MNHYLWLALGIGCAAGGGDLFVRGMIGMAKWLRVSPAFLASTIAAFATSMPELSVSLHAAAAGSPEISLGDALGSNMVNVALVLGLALLVSGVECRREAVKRDFLVAVLAAVLIGLAGIDGTLSRFDAVLLLAAFLAWLAATAKAGLAARQAPVVSALGARGWAAAARCAIGLALLVVAGELIVDGARGIARSLGLDGFLVGATIVALGTSVPELSTAVVAMFRRHGDVALGTVIGSNIFNSLFVVAVAASIHPITLDWQGLGLVLASGLIALALAYPSRGNRIGRGRGLSLLGLYATYVAAAAFSG